MYTDARGHKKKELQIKIDKQLLTKNSSEDKEKDYSGALGAATIAGAAGAGLLLTENKGLKMQINKQEILELFNESRDLGKPRVISKIDRNGNVTQIHGANEPSDLPKPSKTNSVFGEERVKKNKEDIKRIMEKVK
jgi:hypothetical protein